MLHPINPPRCLIELLHIVLLQQRMLEFAEANSRYTDAALQTVMPDEFVNWLMMLKVGNDKGARTANRFIQELNAYVKCPQLEKSQILADFESDQDYYVRKEDPAFTFSLLPSKSNTYEKARDCLREFYELLSEGYPPTLVGHPSGSNPFTKISIVEGYIATNPNIAYVCPCCDNAFTDSANADDQGYTLEHYFPKSLYPSVCMHPMNLIPMCSGCNSRKGNINPLNLSTTSSVIRVAYQEIFHPISRPVRAVAKLHFQKSSTPPDLMEFVAKNPPPTYMHSINAYSVMYQIPDRWQTNWVRVDHQIDRCVRHAIKRLDSQVADEQGFSSVLDEAIQELEEGFGRDHLSYPAANWLSWAKQHRFQELVQSFCPS